MKAALLLFLVCVAEADDLYRTVHALQDKVNLLEEQLKSSQGGQDADMASRLSASETKIEALQTRLSESEKLVEELQRHKSAYHAQLSTVQTQVSTVQTQVSTLWTQVSTVQTQVATVQSLQTQVDTLKTQVATIQSLQTQVSTVQTQVSTVQTQVEELRNVELVKDTLANLESSYNQLQNRFDQFQLESRCPVTENPEDRKKSLCESDGFTWDSGLCYFISTGNSWEQSRQWCKDRTSDLIIIKSQEKKDLVDRVLPRGTAVWIGLSDRDTEGSFKWVDGTSLTSPTFWNPTEPNDRGGDEDCVDNNNVHGSDRGWNDAPCSYTWIRGMCERVIQ